MKYNSLILSLFVVSCMFSVSKAMENSNDLNAVKSDQVQLDGKAVQEEPAILGFLNEYKVAQAEPALKALYETIERQVDRCRGPEEFDKTATDLQNSIEVQRHLEICAYLTGATPEDQLDKLAMRAWQNKRTDIGIVAYNMKNSQFKPNVLLSKESVSCLAVRGAYKIILDTIKELGSESNPSSIVLAITQNDPKKNTNSSKSANTKSSNFQFFLMQDFYCKVNADRDVASAVVAFKKELYEHAKKMNKNTNDEMHTTAHIVAEKINSVK